MNKLTKREKMLLYALAVVAILAGGIKFFVIPAADYYFEISGELMSQQAKADEINRGIERLPQIKKELKTLELETDGYEAMLYPFMTNEELDGRITNMISGFTPISVKMESAVPTEISEYGMAEGNNKPILISNTATVTMTGGIGDFIELADSISRNTSMRVSSFDIKVNRTSGNYTFVFVLAAYMNYIEG